MTRDHAALIGAALLVSVPALLPYHADPLRAFYQDWLAFVLGLLAAVSVLWPRRGESIALPPVALGLLGLALIISVQVALGRVTYVESSVTGILYTTWAALLVIAGARLREAFGAERTARALQAGFAASGFLLAMTGFVALYGIEVGGIEIVLPQGPSMVGAVGQRNYFANLVACGLASVLFLAARGTLRWSIAVPVIVPMVLALALSASRGAWAFVAVIVVFAVLRRRHRRLVVAALATAALFVAASWAIGAGWLAIPEGQEAGADRIAEMLSATGARADSVRAALALAAWQVFLAHPVLGAGWGELAWNMFRLAPDLGLAAPVPVDKHSHNLVLQLLAETGIAGAACVLVPLTVWFWRRPRRHQTTIAAWISAIAAIQILQAMVELPHWHAYLLGPFALVLGLGSAPRSYAQTAAVRCTLRGGWSLAPKLFLAAAIAAAAVRLADYRALERWTAEASATLRAGRPLPPELLGRLERLGTTVFAPEVELIAAQLQAGADPKAEAELIARAMHVFPLPALARRYAELLDGAGRRDEAARVRAAAAIAFGRDGSRPGS